MGYPGQVNHPEVQKTIEYLVNEIKNAGKAVGTVAYDIDALRKCKERGIQFVVYNIAPMLVKSGREYLAVARAD
jgi:4-hydroxy-2-oxoheptanedioate aldolase